MFPKLQEYSVCRHKDWCTVSIIERVHVHIYVLTVRDIGLGDKVRRNLNEACSLELGRIGSAVSSCVHKTVKLIKSCINTSDRKQRSRGEWKLQRALDWND